MMHTRVENLLIFSVYSVKWCFGTYIACRHVSNIQKHKNLRHRPVELVLRHVSSYVSVKDMFILLSFGAKYVKITNIYRFYLCAKQFSKPVLRHLWISCLTVLISPNLQEDVSVKHLTT